jgi:ABC-type sugar transport system ATPase subunit
MAQVTLEHLSKRFGQAVAVEDLSILIEDRELIVFVGPSGCGKTTTLNCIGGLEVPTSGHIYFDDVDVTEVPPHRRNIAMVFQESTLYPHLTGRQNINMSLRKSNLDQEEVVRRIEEVATIVDIHPLLDKLPAHMSGGERQRVAIAKAIVRQPSVFLMDEPLANLDAALREALRAEISVLQKSIETTMVFVTHDQVEAMTMGDRVAVMAKGKLQQVGTPDAVYNKPANTFVARFIGSPPMHLFEGELRREEGQLQFAHEDFTLALPDSYQGALDALKGERRVILGVRPQHMYVGAEPLSHGFSAQVYAVEQLGKEAIMIAAVGTDLEDRVKVLIPPQAHWAREDTVWIGIQEEHVLLFDETTEENLLLKQ